MIGIRAKRGRQNRWGSNPIKPAAFTNLLSDGGQVNPIHWGTSNSSGIGSAQQEIMHMMGFDERYSNRPHEGFKGDVMSSGPKVYIHAQHFYDIFSFTKKRKFSC